MIHEAYTEDTRIAHFGLLVYSAFPFVVENTPIINDGGTNGGNWTDAEEVSATHQLINFHMSFRFI